MFFQLRYLIRHMWGFRTIIPKKPVKVLTLSSTNWCILFSDNSISSSSGRPKYPSTYLAHKWHIQLAAHLNFEGDNINQCHITKHLKLRMSLNVLLNKWSLYAKENKILETCWKTNIYIYICVCVCVCVIELVNV